MSYTLKITAEQQASHDRLTKFRWRDARDALRRSTADPDDTGMGHDAAPVSAFTAPDAATLLDHYDAVLKSTQKYLAALDPNDTDRMVETPPPATVGERLLAVLNGNMQHIGQAGYVRGLNEGRRWHPRGRDACPDWSHHRVPIRLISRFTARDKNPAGFEAGL